MTRHDLELDGPPIRLRALADVLGVSRHKLYADVRRGLLDVVGVRCGTLVYWHVERHAAIRYLEAIGYRWSASA